MTRSGFVSSCLGSDICPIPRSGCTIADSAASSTKAVLVQERDAGEWLASGPASSSRRLGDVGRERLRASMVVRRLDREFRRFFTVEAYFWEHEVQLAT